ncbi:hypothetical protein SVAN01_09365 [Stagonosporopsis vannaccii]|nr:hypothetical protein SVAN01_09365 [Stagonosporopsis vannaccii]
MQHSELPQTGSALPRRRQPSATSSPRRSKRLQSMSPTHSEADIHEDRAVGSGKRLSLVSPSPEQDMIANGASGTPDQAAPMASGAVHSKILHDAESHSVLDNIFHGELDEVKIQVQALLEHMEDAQKTQKTIVQRLKSLDKGQGSLMGVFVVQSVLLFLGSSSNAACLPKLQAWESQYPLPTTEDDIMRHPYYSHHWQNEWRSDSSARRKQFNLFSSICEYMSAGQRERSETALTLNAAAATPTMSALATELNALIPYIQPGQLAAANSSHPASFAPNDDELYGDHQRHDAPLRQSSLVARLGDIIRTVPTPQFPVRADGHLQWLFRMPDQAIEEPTED